MWELAGNESLVRLQSTEISEAGNQNYIVGRSSMAVVFSVGTTFVIMVSNYGSVLKRPTRQY
jgi:hypothetical protein